MRISAGWGRVGLLLVVAMVAGGCGTKEKGATNDTTTVADTGAIGGLTPDEIRARAEPMSPEKAESLGIVDTTIHVEVHDPNDTLPIPRKPPVP